MSTQLSPSTPQIRIEPIPHKVFGAKITGVKLAELDDNLFSQIHQAFLTYGFLIFPDQHLNDAQNIEFGERFGRLEFGALPMANQEKHLISLQKVQKPTSLWSQSCTMAINH